MEPGMMDKQFFEELLNVSLQMARTRIVEPLLTYAMSVALDLVGAEKGHIILRNPDATLDFRVSLDNQGCEIPHPEEQISRSILNKVMNENTPLILRDAINDELFNGEASVSLLELRSVMCVPLTTYQKTIGAIYVENRSAAAVFRDQDLDPLNFFATQAAVFIENAMLNEHLEEQVRMHTLELQKNQANLQALTENTQDGIWSVDREFRILTINSTYRETFKQAFGVMLTPGMYILKAIPDDNERECWRVRYEQVLNGVCVKTEVVYQLRDQRKYYDISLSPIYDKRRVITGVTAFSRDMTEHKHVAEALQQAKEVAEAANQAKSAFLANMSHELRTPLNTILGFTQLVVHNPEIPPVEQENLKIIQRSGEHLLTLINQVLDLSKIEAGHLVLNENEFNLYRLLDDVEDMFSLKAQHKGLALVFERSSEISPYIKADEVKLRQVLINLLSNAIKFTEHGKITLRVEIKDQRFQTQGEHPFQVSTVNLQCSISDTGPGIATEELDRLFEAFTQTESSRYAQEGTGLGLTISQKFVHLMGGDIWVESVVGVGTTFIFDIPITLIDEPALELTRTLRVVALEPDQSRYRILIVDDKPDNRLVLVKLLEPLGFEVCEADSGQEAIDCWKSFAPHLILMDLRMPAMDGYEATQEIRKLERASRRSNNTDAEFQTCIIAISASSFGEERQSAVEKGCNGFITKPFYEADIFQLLHTYLGVRFIYEKREQKHAKAPEHNTTLLHSTLVALPHELRTGLQQAVDMLDLELTNEVIEKIGSHNHILAEILRDLLEHYRFDTLQDALEQIRSQ